jgi:hypothetical protein
MKPAFLPDFFEGVHYRQLHPTREGGRRWRFVTMRRPLLPVRGIVQPGRIIAFCDAGGVERGRIDDRGIVMSEGYAWNGCSPKRWVWPVGWVGTPDFQATILASGFHDLLYQFSQTQHFPLSRCEVDQVFRHCIEMSGEPEIARIYFEAVRCFGTWANRPNKGEFSVLL